MMRGRRGKPDSDGVWWGLILLTLGGMFLLSNVGLVDRGLIKQWWVVFPIVFGIGRLVSARTAKAVSEGVFLLLIGVWFLIAVTEWMGLTWRSSWPLALIAVGASTLAEAIAGAFMPKRAKDEKECGT